MDLLRSRTAMTVPATATRSIISATPPSGPEATLKPEVRGHRTQQLSGTPLSTMAAQAMATHGVRRTSVRETPAISSTAIAKATAPVESAVSWTGVN